MICNKCNRKLPDDSEFCQYCGSKVERATASPVEMVVVETEKESPSVTVPPAPVEVVANNATIPSDSAPQTVQTVKAKYCSRCGGEIDSLTKKCNKCGKQYFKGIQIHKIPWKELVAVVVVATVVVMCVLQYMNTLKLNANISELKDKIDRSELNEGVVVWEAEGSVFAVNPDARFVGKTGLNKYHKIGCSQIEASNGVWVFETEEVAAQKGFAECPYCH